MLLFPSNSKLKRLLNKVFSDPWFCSFYIDCRGEAPCRLVLVQLSRQATSSSTESELPCSCTPYTITSLECKNAAHLHSQDDGILRRI